MKDRSGNIQIVKLACLKQELGHSSHTVPAYEAPKPVGPFVGGDMMHYQAVCDREEYECIIAGRSDNSCVPVRLHFAIDAPLRCTDVNASQ